MKLNVEEYLFSKLAEKCNEVAKEVLKSQIFGLNDVYPNMDKNAAHESNAKKSLAKNLKVSRYMEYSVSVGALDMSKE